MSDEGKSRDRTFSRWWETTGRPLLDLGEERSDREWDLARRAARAGWVGREMLAACPHACPHQRTTFDPKGWPGGYDLEVCLDCGMSRTHWEQGESGWCWVEIERERRELALNEPAEIVVPQGMQRMLGRPNRVSESVPLPMVLLLILCLIAALVEAYVLIWR
jgi:hypothetical protein